MNLVQFVALVRQGSSAEEIAARHTPHPDVEELGIYLENKASLTSELAFFDLEQVPPYIFITVAGKQCEAFFSASELADLIPEYEVALGHAASSLAISEALLHYHDMMPECAFLALSTLAAPS
jgi:hypothetical protein